MGKGGHKILQSNFVRVEMRVFTITKEVSRRLRVNSGRNDLSRICARNGAKSQLTSNVQIARILRTTMTTNGAVHFRNRHLSSLGRWAAGDTGRFAHVGAQDSTRLGAAPYR